MKMSNDSIPGAREFVVKVELPDPPPPNINVSKSFFDYDSEKQQAVVVGAGVIASVKRITPEQRNDIVNASLLAQLVAKKKIPKPTTLTAVKDWYEAYFD